MPLEELRPTNNYVTYEQLQKLLADRLEALGREIEIKLLQLKESKFNYFEEKLNLKAELEALKEQFRILNSEFITRITNLNYKVLEINGFFTQKLAELNHQFAELNTSLLSEFEKYRRDFSEFLSKNDLRTFFENNSDLIPYLLSPMINEFNEFKNKLSAIEKSLNLVHNLYTNINDEINKQVNEIIKETIDKLKEIVQGKISSLEINPNIDITALNEFKNEVSQRLNNIIQDISELKSFYQSSNQNDHTQILADINSKLDELKSAQIGKEFITVDFPDTEILKKFSEEVKNDLAVLKKISEEIALNMSSLTFAPSVNSDESLKLMDAKISKIKTAFDEIVTSQYEIQNNIGNLLEKTAVATAEIQNISKVVKKEILENFQVVKSQILGDIRTQTQGVVTSINTLAESIQSLKGYPAVVILCTFLIIGVMLLLKFVF